MVKKIIQSVSRLWELAAVSVRVQYYFFDYTAGAIGLNDLSEAIQASKTSTKKAVLDLVKAGFLKVEEIGKAWRIKADAMHPFMRTRKVPYNLQLVFESGLISNIYNKIPGARAIILFGSYRWGTNDENSDLDIAVEILGDSPLKIETMGLLPELGFRKDVKVNLHIFSRKNVDSNLFINIVNGVVLDGLIEVGN